MDKGEDEFDYWVELPAGTRHVVFGELPHLIALALWPAAELHSESQDFAYGGARLNLEEELRTAVGEGRLKVCDPLTFGPHTFPLGAPLKGSLVLLPDLRTFLAHRGGGIGVRVSTLDPALAGESTDARCNRMLSWLREEEAKQVRGAQARVARRDGRARQTVAADISRARKAEQVHSAPLAAMARAVRR